MLALNHSIQKVISRINRYVESWKRHQSLWKTEKSSVLEKFKARDPTNAQFEEKLAKYTKVCTLCWIDNQVSLCTLALVTSNCVCGQLAEEIYSQAKEFDLDFIQISCHSLAASVRDEALGWVKATSNAMQDIDMLKLQHLKDKINNLSTGIRKQPESLEDLKDILNVVNTIRMSG